MINTMAESIVDAECGIYTAKNSSMQQEKLKMQIQQELQSQQVQPGVEENMAQEELSQVDREVAMPQEELDEIDPATEEPMI